MLKCLKCKSEKISRVSIQWSFDWWLYYNCECEPWINRHRTNNERIKKQKQPELYWPVFFKTKAQYFKNLDEITEKEYNILSIKQEVRETWSIEFDDLFWGIFKNNK